MEILVMSEKGQVTIPRALRKRLNIEKGSPLLADVDATGAIRLVPAAVIPLETYSKERLAEFAAEDALSPAEAKRFSKALGQAPPRASR